jgi:hypothetical protein
MGDECSTYGGEELCISGSVRKPERKRPLGRLRRRWNDNIQMDLHKVGYSVDWYDQVQG